MTKSFDTVETDSKKSINNDNWSSEKIASEILNPDEHAIFEPISNDAQNLLQINQYRLIKYIGFGSTSKVFQVFKNNVHFAAKIINHDNLSMYHKKICLPSELNILRSINHFNIIKLIEIIENVHFTIIIFEYANDGDLITWLTKQTEPNLLLAKCWFQQIMSAVCYLHSLKIIHGDIKADNVLLCNNVAKLTDFGYAQIYSNDNLNIACGTMEYRAPETFIHSINSFQTDCFSMGVLLYSMVTLMFPFGFGSKLRTITGIKQQYDDINRKNWTLANKIPMNSSLFSLLKQLLNPDPMERITARQALKHSWLIEKNH